MLRSKIELPKLSIGQEKHKIGSDEGRRFGLAALTKFSGGEPQKRQLRDDVPRHQFVDSVDGIITETLEHIA